MRCKWHFRNEVSENFSEVPAFRLKSKWNPPTGSPALELFLSRLEADIFALLPGINRNLNLNRKEWLAMKGLAADRSIVIKQADKGSCVVVRGREDYLAEAERQLNDNSIYETFKNDREVCSKLAERSNAMFQTLAKKKCISEKELKYFLYPYEKAANLGKFYLLPKIHKRLENVPGRPIISNCGTPTEKASEFLDHHLKPLMQSGRSYIKDSGHFISMLKDLGEVPKNSILVTADVVGLYPSIPHLDGLEALRKKLETRTNKKVATADLVNMAEFVLTNNIFEFGQLCKRQIAGTAMGTKFAPPYACIFMDILEEEFLNSEPLKPWCWKHYIDDIFLVWTHGEQSLREFLGRLNERNSNIKFTHEMSVAVVNFLDVNVSIENGQFATNLFCKPTDCHQYLHYQSCHPHHTKSSTVYSQGLRVRKVCSNEKDFADNIESLKQWFLCRGYPSFLIDKELGKVMIMPRAVLFEERQKEPKNAVPLVVDFCPILSSLPKLIRSLAFILHLDAETKKVFPEIPFVSFRSPRNLSSYLVRARLYPDTEKRPGSKKCGENNIETTEFFESSDNRIYKINHHLDCNSSNIVYMLKCNVCEKKYVGQTTTKFRFRWNNYRNCARKAAQGENVPQSSFHEHFLGPDHNGFEKDCSIILFDKTDAHSPVERESFWIHTLKTLSPTGLNSVEE